MKLLFISLLILSALISTSCDAVLTLTYSIRNTSADSIELFIPNFPINPEDREFSRRVDTTLILQPNESTIVGFQSKIDFPWATKNIYRKTPGICGIQQIDGDSTTTYNCSQREWKYRRKRAVLLIR